MRSEEVMEKEGAKNTINSEEGNNVSNGTKSEDGKGKKAGSGKKIGVIVLCILAVIALAVGLVSCNKMADTEIDYALIQNIKALDYSKEGKKINPIELVTIYRVIDNNYQNESSSEKRQTDAGLIITCKPTSIDTSKTGGTKVTFTVKDKEHAEATKKLTATFKVVDNSQTSDTSAIKFSDIKIGLKVGDDFDVKSVVSDAGDYKLVDKTPEKNGDGTYDTAWYTLTSNVDTSKAGTYEVKIHYVDKDGKTADKKITVTVKEKADKEANGSSETADSSSGKKSASSANISTSGGTNTKQTQNNAPVASKQPSGASFGNSDTASSSNKVANASNGGGSATDNVPNGTCTKKQVQTKAAWTEQVLVSAAYDETVVDQEAYDEQVYQGTTTVCNGCGQEFSSYQEWVAHSDSYLLKGDIMHGGYHSYDTYTTVHHDAVTHVVHHDAVYTTVNHPAEYTEVCN